MNRKELIDELARQTGHSKRSSGETVSALLEIITSALKGIDDVRIDGLGRFSMAIYPARIIHHPRTGERLKIPASRRVVFRPSTQLKKLVNVI